MKGLRFIVTIVAAGLLLMPMTAKAAPGEGVKGAPPIAQTLVREGDFAVQLASALNLGTFDNEAKAEDVLTSLGIAPRNGWIANYPLTPDIVGELKDSIGRAADSSQLVMDKVSADKTFDDLTVRVGLPVVAGSEWEYDNGSSSSSYSDSSTAGSNDYVEPSVVNNYYYDEGPPVVSYYAPPWDYAYLYSWVPWPFWYTGFYFPGFFILNDFDRVIVVDRDRDGRFHRGHINRGDINRVSNHVFNRSTNSTALVDPVRRSTGAGLRSISSVNRTIGTGSTAFRNSAQSIIRHNATGGLSRTSVNGTGRVLDRGGTNMTSRLSPALPGRISEPRLSSFGSGVRSFEPHSSMNFGRSFASTGSVGFHSGFNNGFSGGSSFRSFGGGGFAHGGFAHGGMVGGGMHGGRR